MSQIIWKLSLMVPSLSCRIYAGHSSTFSLRDKENLKGCSPACCGEGKLVLGHSSRPGGLFSPLGAQGLKGGAASQQNSWPPTEAPGLGPGPMCSQSLAGPLWWFYSIFRYKGSRLENPRGRGIFYPMQIVLSSQPSVTPVSSQPCLILV